MTLILWGKTASAIITEDKPELWSIDFNHNDNNYNLKAMTAKGVSIADFPICVKYSTLSKV